jgi:hypothetical protein
VKSFVVGARWSEIHERRLQWAYDGFRKFVDRLQDPAIQNLYRQRNHGRPIIVTYGLSQQGKTTVLLQLLGVDSESPEADRVEDVLRGGRPPGVSATASALRYRIAADNKWRVKVADGKPSLETADDATATEYIKNIRTQAEKNRLPSDEPVQVEIPACYAKKATECIIIDLPGLGSRDANEQAHVAAMMSRWFEVASTVMVVLRKRDLSTLKDLPGQFFTMPSRYRLVLTYATTDATDQLFFETTKSPSLATWRAHQQDAVVRTFPDFPAQLLIYPFDGGHSRRSIKDATIQNRVRQVVSESMTALCENLDVTPYALLAQQADYHLEVKEHYLDKRRQREEKIDATASQLKRSRQLAQRHRNDAAAAKAQEAEAKQEIRRWEQLKPKFDWSDLPTPPHDNDNQKLINWVMRDLGSWLDERIEPALGAFPVLEAVKNARMDFSADLQSRLRQAVGFFRNLASSKEAICQVYRKVTEQALTELEQRIQQAIQQTANAKKKAASTRQVEAHENLLIASQKYMDERRNIQHLRSQWRRAVQAHHQKTQQEDQEIAQATRFWDIIEAEWAAQDAELRLKIAQAEQPLERLYISLERGLRAIARSRLIGAKT